MSQNNSTWKERIQSMQGITPFFLAIRNGNRDLASNLISWCGADVNQTTTLGRTPLHWAIEHGNEDMVLFLIEKGANVNQTRSRLNVQNDITDWIFHGETPIFVAAKHNHSNLVKLLLRHGAEASINEATSCGLTPLIIAAKYGYHDVIKELIAGNADVNICDRDGKNPIYIAAEFGHVEIIALLLDARAEFKTQANNGMTPLSIATTNGHRKVACLLTKNLLALIEPAIKSGNTKNLKLILVNHEDVNLTDPDGNTLLHLAICWGKPSVLAWLVTLPNINLNAYNKNNDTPFTLAMKLRNPAIITIIDRAVNALTVDIDIEDITIDINEQLGHGSFGVVFKGMYQNEIVAIKSTRNCSDHLRQLERENNTMLKFRSPYLLHLIGLARVSESELKLVLQYMDGGDLRNHLDKKRNNEPTLTNYSPLEIAWAIASGLDDIHHKNFVHRDLKSHNVLLSTKHYIKLADLGLTRDIASMMTQGVGTLYWTAPEVLKDVGGYGAPADIYSFGVVLTELDTLVLPYSNLQLTPFIIQNRVCDGSLRPALSGKCKPWYKNLVGRCLNDDPKLRPSASDIVAIIEKQFLKSDNDDEDDVVEESTEAEHDMESSHPSSNSTTASFSSSKSKVPIVPRDMAAIDIKCPSCKDPNSLSNDVCKKCNKALLTKAIRINILIKRLEDIHLKPQSSCTICQFENDVRSSACAACKEELVDADKVTQLVAQLMEAP